jgi:hypothetical protein
MTDQHRTDRECVSAELCEHVDHAREAQARGETVPESEWAYMRGLRDWLVAHPEPEPNIVEIDTDELSDETRAEVVLVAEPILTGTKIDKGERKVLLEELDVLWARREMLMQDVTADNRLERIDECDEQMKDYRERLIFLDVLIGAADEPYDGPEGR